MTASYILRVDCPDRPGIVAAVANALVSADCNIQDAAQFGDSHSGRFFMRVVFQPLQAAERGATAGHQRFLAAFADSVDRFDMRWDVRAAAEPTRAVIMVSKADHCLNDLLYRRRTGQLNLDIAHVISNHEECRALADQAGVPFTCLPVDKGSKLQQEASVAALVEQAEAEIIVLARYMQVLSPELCARYKGRIINIHHSFLPGFKGASPYRQAWERGVKIIGATAHFVTPDLDEGPIIEQQTARVTHASGPDEMAVMGRDIEAQVLARALAYYAERRIFLHGNRTIIL